MKYYAQFQEFDLKGNLVDAFGSDGVYILDGRNTLDTMINDAEKQLYRLTCRGYKRYKGYTIQKGNRFDNSITVYDSLK